MNETTTIRTTDVELDEAVRQLLETTEERVTIVHCRLLMPEPGYYRIWPQTCLVEDGGGRRSLLQALGVVLAPAWMPCFAFRTYVRFTLVFEGLGKDCRSFHLDEDIPESLGFYTDPVPRNETDVYNVLLKEKAY
ncbi:MAG TPA: hypothetical protein PKE07_08035 [Lacibacter sp.]|nr:hypothetical protein [Lacibacter sp.]HMO89855.1 hypothetical protein [Lacibacter sp.]